MVSTTQARNIFPVLLLLFGLLPVAVGVVRMGIRLDPGGGDADTARFFTMPLAVMLHVLSGGIFSVLAPLQLAAGLRQTPWHRRAGRVLVLAGLVAALSALWLNQFFPHNVTDGPLLYWIRLAAGLAMLWFLMQGYFAATRRQISLHRAHMIRAYALGVGVSTQIVIGIVHISAFGSPLPLVGDLLVGLGWLINLSVAELAIRRGHRPSGWSCSR